MMAKLYWQTYGQGNCQIVLLHGWGLNAQIWRYISLELSEHFTVHVVDLPGFGRSQGYPALSLEQMGRCILRQMPARAIWLGWSLGGLLATQIALTHPERVDALITVASSPCFVERLPWPGIKRQVLDQFQQQLNIDYQKTVERFLVLQTLGSQTSREEFRTLKNAIFEQPIPTTNILNGGLEILKTSDFRSSLPQINKPFFRIYGKLDALVPGKIISILDKTLPYSPSLTIDKAAHAPFISHPGLFCQQVVSFVRDMLKENTPC